MNCFTIIIPTHNRHDYLRRNLCYLNTFENFFDIVVLDSSNEEFIYLNEFECRIKYRHSPGLNFYGKFFDIKKFIETEYVLICADDDFVILESVLEIIKYLDKNREYGSGQGVSQSFFLNKNNKLSKFNTYNNMVEDYINDDSSSNRILHFMKNYIYPTHYSVIRTTIFIKIFDKLSSQDNIFLYYSQLYEFLLPLYLIIESKHFVHNIFYYAREIIFNSSGHLIITVDEVITNKKYKNDYNIFLSSVSEYLSRIENINLNDARKIIEEAIQVYVYCFLPEFHKLKILKKIFYKKKIIHIVFFLYRIILKIITKIKLDRLFHLRIKNLIRQYSYISENNKSEEKYWSLIEMFILKHSSS